MPRIQQGYVVFFDLSANPLHRLKAKHKIFAFAQLVVSQPSSLNLVVPEVAAVLKAERKPFPAVADPAFSTAAPEVEKELR
jgi:hypothetical protein